MIAILGNGVYSFNDAARLLGVSQAKAGAWFHGWRGGREPIFNSDYRPAKTRVRVISFLDLIDASVAVALRNKGATLHTIRRVRDELAKAWSTDHPFSRQELWVDKTGRRVFSRVADESGDETFIEVLKKQHAIPQVMLPFLNRVQYDPHTRLAHRLQLMEGLDVLIDPKRRYGKPIVGVSGMPTTILNEAYKANKQDADAVADWYNVSADEVLDAVRFEQEFSGIAA